MHLLVVQKTGHAGDPAPGKVHDEHDIGGGFLAAQAQLDSAYEQHDPIDQLADPSAQIRALRDRVVEADRCVAIPKRGRDLMS